MVVLGQDGHRRQRGHTRLADGHQVRSGADDAKKCHQMLGVFIQTKAPGMQWHVARIVPIGNVDVVIRQRGAVKCLFTDFGETS